MSIFGRTAGNGNSGSSVDAGTLTNSGGSALQNWTFASGLAGDSDGDYEGTFLVIVPAAIGGNYSFSFNANSAPTGAVDLAPQMSSAAAFTATGTNGFFVGRDPVGGGGTLTARWRMESKSGRIRMWTCQTIYKDGGGTSYTFDYRGYIPSSTNTVITDLRLLCDTAGGIGAGTIARWRKLGFTA